jgi:ABC-type amino acid transport substrate-binding protein
MRRSAATLLLLLCLIAPASAGTLEKIRESGFLALGYREASPPFSYKNEKGRPAGFSVDLCNRIADAVRKQLALPELEIRYVPVTVADRVEKLITGDIDIECGSTTRTIARQTQVDFTLMTFATGTELLVRVGSNINGIPDLAGKKVALLPGTTNDAVIRAALVAQVVDAEIVPVKDHDAGVAAVEDGTVDAYASDEVLLIGLARKAKDPSQLRLSGQLYSYEPYALMVRQDDAAFRLIADRTLAETFRSLDIAKVYARWFGDWNASPNQFLIALYLLESVPE